MKQKNHIVLVGSTLGNQIGFTEENFHGNFPRGSMRVVKPKGGRAIEAKATELPVGSYLWIDEEKSRFMIIQCQVKDPNFFSMEDLIVNIGDFGYDVAFLSKPGAEFKLSDEYVFEKSEESWKGIPCDCYTIKSKWIIEVLKPRCSERMRYTQLELEKTLRNHNPSEKDKVFVINVAKKMLSAKDPYVYNPEIETEQEFHNRYQTANNMLWSFLFAKNENDFPPNPRMADEIIKENGIWRFNGVAWMHSPMPPEPLAPVPARAS